MSRAPFHIWRLIYENASVCFCPKMPCTNVHCLTPSPTKRPVDVTRGKSEYVDSPLYSSFNGSCGYWGFPASHVAPQVIPWLVVVFQWFSLVPWFSWFPWLVCVLFCFLLFLLFLWFLMFLWFSLLVWLQSDVASQQLINLTLKMTIARFVETSVTVNNNPFQDHTHLDDHFPPTLDTGIYFHLSQYSGSFKVTLSCSKKHFVTDLTYVQKPSLLLEKQLLARRYLPIYSESTEEEIFWGNVNKMMKDRRRIWTILLRCPDVSQWRTKNLMSKLHFVCIFASENSQLYILMLQINWVPFLSLQSGALNLSWPVLGSWDL